MPTGMSYNLRCYTACGWRRVASCMSALPQLRRRRVSREGVLLCHAGSKGVPPCTILEVICMHHSRGESRAHGSTNDLSVSRTAYRGEVPPTLRDMPHHSCENRHYGHPLPLNHCH